MALRVKRTDINDAQVYFIRSHLYFQPKQSFLSERYGQQAKNPVLFYLVRDGDVFLPLTFGRAFTQTFSNRDYPPTSFDFTGELFSHQVPVAEEALSQLLSRGTTTIGLYPGFGKTVIGAYLSSHLKLKVAVLYHREFLGPQWETTFKQFTNATTWIVPTGFSGTPPDVDVVLCMDTRYSSLSEEYRLHIGCLIIDEAHAFCTPSRVECLLSWEPRYAIAETATLIRDDEMHRMIYAICGTHGIFKTLTKSFQVLHLETGLIPETKQNIRGGLDWSSLTRWFSTCEDRNKMILSLVKNNPSHKILILTLELKHVSLLHELLQQENESVDYFAGSRKTYSDSRVLIGTISKIGTGFDEKTSCPNFNGKRIDMLILCSSVKKASLLEQSVGRVFRADMPIIIDLVDSHDVLKRHWYERKKWYQSRNGIISHIKMVPTSNDGISTSTEDSIRNKNLLFLSNKIRSLKVKS